jgi:hypothetical protein
MRTSTLAMLVVFGGAIASPATAQQNPGQQQPVLSEKMHPDADTGHKGSGPSEQMQREADKGAKTRNSGESGYVADQDKAGTSAHPPGRSETMGSTSQTGAPK